MIFKLDKKSYKNCLLAECYVMFFFLIFVKFFRYFNFFLSPQSLVTKHALKLFFNKNNPKIKIKKRIS